MAALLESGMVCILLLQGTLRTVMDASPGYDARLKQLERDLALLAERLRALELRQPQLDIVSGTNAVQDAERAAAAQAPPLERASTMTSLATLIGRALMVMGGAYLLRALTESGRLPNAGGILLGLAYAWFWLAAAWKDAPLRRLSAQFHGVTALLIGLPLVWEATIRFGFLGPGTAACVIALLGTSGFVVARRGRLHVVSGVAGFGTLAAAFATAWSTNHYAASSLLLIGLSAATYWLAEEPARGWLRWPTAIAAGLSVIGVTLRAIATPPREPAWLALLTQAALLGTMQASLAVRVLLLGRNMRLFDILQAASALLIGVGGAMLIARHLAAGLGLIGAVTAILACGAYLAAFYRLSDRPHLARSYHTFATFGMAATIIALGLLMSGGLLTIVALLLAIVTLSWGTQRLGGYAPMHGAAYVTVALAASGTLSVTAKAWAQNIAPWPSITALSLVCLGVSATCATLRPPKSNETGDILAHSGQFIIAFASVVGIGGALVILLAPLVAGTPIDTGILASLRTAVLSIVVVALGASARWSSVAVFSRLVYPVLVLGGVRLLFDDLRHSSPSTLFIALALYGLAWTLGPRLVARSADPKLIVEGRG